jgi:soluble lytic murein transglycosylase-like protein
VTADLLLPPSGEGWDGGRRRACGAIAGLGLLLLSGRARAGGQLEEPLADSVRSALSSAIANSAPPIPDFTDTDKRLAYLRWLGAMSTRLRKRKTEWQERKEFLQTVWYESKRAGLDPGLVLGLIQVESAFRKFAVSSVGARGYMQVMPFWTRVIGDGDAGKLFHMQTNLRFGCVILRHYIDREKGDLFMALGRYNGSRGKPQYPNAVFGAAKNWDFHDLPQAEKTPDPTKPLDKAPSGPN